MSDLSHDTFETRYRIDRQIGSGGMAIVYLAYDHKHKRQVAIKQLRPEVAEGIGRERFSREIRIASMLQHPNIVPLFDSGESNGRHYFVMPYMNGPTLRKRISHVGRLSVHEVVHLIREVAEALAYAHGQGVIHRDIKPENIILVGERAVLADFGIARAVHEARQRLGPSADTLTHAWMQPGTPGYMSPEQAVGNSSVDHRADLYALAVVAYEMLTGKTPFTSRRAEEVLAAQVARPAPPILDSRPDVLPALASLVMQCLEKDPNRRLQSATEIIRQLELMASSGGIPPPAAVGNNQRRSDDVRRWGARVSLAIMALVTSVGGALFVRSKVTNNPRKGDSTAGSAALPSTVHLGVLPISMSNGTADSSRLQLLQYLFVSELARYRGLGLVEPASLNSRLSATAPDSRKPVARSYTSWGLQYVVRLTATKTLRGLDVAYVISDAASGDVVGTGSFADSSDRDLQTQIRQAGERLVGALETRTGGLTRRLDVAPFLINQRRPAAVSAFLQGVEYAYRGLSGGGPYFRRAVELDSNFIAPRIFLVSGLVLDGDTSGALRHVRHLESLKVNATQFEQALIEWAAAAAKGDLDARIRHLRVALSYSPGNNILLYDLAAALWMAGRSSEAIAPALEAMQSGWRFSPLFTLWGVVAIETDRLKGLRDTLEASLRYTPLEPYVTGLLEALAMVDGDSSAVRRYHSAFIDQLGPAQSASGYAEMAVIYRTLAHRARARREPANEAALLAKALDAQPRMTIARLELARVHLEAGKRREAKALYRQVSDSSLRDSTALVLAGQIAEQLGLASDAIRQYLKYLNIAPHGSDADRVRERLRTLGRQ